MKLNAAMDVSTLNAAGLVRKPLKDSRTAMELARELFAEADHRGEPFLHHTPESWVKKWLPSKLFRLVRLPLNAAALPCEPKGQNLVLKKIHAREEKPIIVEFNKNRIGSTLNGFAPPVIVIDGKHRFKAAMLRGESHIMAWVGVASVGSLHGAARKAFVEASGCICGCGKCGKGMEAHSGSGGGPSPMATTPASGAKLVAKGKDVEAKAQPGKCKGCGKMAMVTSMKGGMYCKACAGKAGR